MRLCSAHGSKDKVGKDITLASYIAWHLWKERNRRVFEQKAMTAIRLAALIRGEVETFYEARGMAADGGVYLAPS